PPVRSARIKAAVLSRRRGGTVVIAAAAVLGAAHVGRPFQGRKGEAESLALHVPAAASKQAEAGLRRVRYSDLTPSIARLWPGGELEFDDYIRAVDADAARRVVEGDREQLLYYALLSNAFTRRPPIEPAVSGERVVSALPAEQRERFLSDDSYVPPAGLPAAERGRVADLLAARGAAPSNARLAYFHRIASGEHHVRSQGAMSSYFRH